MVLRRLGKNGGDGIFCQFRSIAGDFDDFAINFRPICPLYETRVEVTIANDATLVEDSVASSDVARPRFEAFGLERSAEDGPSFFARPVAAFAARHKTGPVSFVPLPFRHLGRFTSSAFCYMTIRHEHVDEKALHMFCFLSTVTNG